MEAQNLSCRISVPKSTTLLSCKHTEACFFRQASPGSQRTRKLTTKKFFCLSHLSDSPKLDQNHGFSTLCALNTDVIDPETSIKRKNLAVFVSGGGSNFRSIHEATLSGFVHGDVVALVTNISGCGGANYARDKGIPVIMYPKTKDESEGLSPVDLVAILRKFEVDFVLLAGYLKLIPVELVQAYPKRIINIHPSLLPAFGGKGYYGMKVHKAVIASGARYSGPTIHFVDEQYDTGRILAQKTVPVLANDTPEELAARVLHQEHKLYVEVVTALCEDRVTFRDDGVPLIRSREDPNKYT